MATNGNEMTPVPRSLVQHRNMFAAPVPESYERTIVPMAGNGYQQQNFQVNDAGSIMAQAYTQRAERTQIQLEKLVSRQQEQLADKAEKWKKEAKKMQTKLEEVMWKANHDKHEIEQSLNSALVEIDHLRNENKNMQAEIDRLRAEPKASFATFAQPSATNTWTSALSGLARPGSSIFSQPSSSFSFNAMQQSSSSPFAQSASNFSFDGARSAGFGSAQAIESPNISVTTVPSAKIPNEDEEDAADLELMGALAAKADAFTKQ